MLFLDRDGIINRELGRYVSSEEDFELNEGIVPVLQYMKSRGYAFAVITNQGGIARGLYTRAVLERIHDKMHARLSAFGIRLEEVYYCPHHPNYSLCLCRKPQSLMLEKAMARLDADPERSFMIGDSDRDVFAAHGAGLSVFRLPSNEIPEPQVFWEMALQAGVKP